MCPYCATTHRFERLAYEVFQQPAKDVIYFRKNGRFPDGAVIIKEVLEAIGSGHTTGKAYWGERGKTWFVMVKDTHGRFTTNPLWGDGWGWAQFYERLGASLASHTGAEREQLHWRCVAGKPPADVVLD